ncbi:hypothetical protein [Kibdelosporangium aridum]|uniref:hypothetical protein n=1 Tax=Kibdelosporangium aridum TaxID=2030 RepID=UPI00163CFFD0|nr:hypothetical protein [Kibdelosporangium aridum]
MPGGAASRSAMLASSPSPYLTSGTRLTATRASASIESPSIRSISTNAILTS